MKTQVVLYCIFKRKTVCIINIHIQESGTDEKNENLNDRKKSVHFWESHMEYHIRTSSIHSWADPEGGGGRQGVQTSPEKSQNIGLFSNTGPDPLKNHQSYQASIQCLDINRLPAKCQLNCVSLAADDGQFKVLFGSSFPSSIKKKKTSSNLDPL